MRINHLGYVDVLQREGEALLAAAAQAPEAKVPSCGEWDMGDLVAHVGHVFHFWATCVDDKIDGEQYEAPAPPGPGATADWAREQLGRLVRVLRAHDPSEEVWSWTPQKDVAFVSRRMAHEAIVHRWDAERAAGIDPDIVPELASDGIDEFLTFFVTPEGWGPYDVPTTSVHLHATDTPGEWLVRLGDGTSVVTREHAKGDAAMRGAASDLLLALWRRVPLDGVDVIGETAAVDALLQAASRD
jgi:uncharacterized protein (TIGR03083 family)